MAEDPQQLLSGTENIHIQATGQRQLLFRTPDRLRPTRGAGEITVCGQSVTLSFAPFWGLRRKSLSCNLDDIYNVASDKDQIQFSVAGKGAELSRTFVFKIGDAGDLNLLTNQLPANRQDKFAAAVKRDGEFDRLLSAATPHLWGTYTLMAISILVFAAMLIKGGGDVLWNPPHNLILGFGANFGPYTFGQGQWWRLLSCQFIHIGIILLLLSMFFLWWFGRIAERLYGSNILILIYLCGGMIGAMPMLWANSIDIIAGSFDGTCAIYGASLGCLWRYRKEFPVKYSRKLLWFLFVLILLIFNSSIGSVGSNIFGLLSGLAFGLMAASPPNGSKRKKTMVNVLKISGLSAIIMTIAILQYNVSRNAPLQTFATICYQEEKSSMTAWRYLTQKEIFDQMVKEKKFGEYINKNILPSFKKIIAQGKTVDRNKLNIVEQRSFDRLMNFATDKQEFFLKLCENPNLMNSL